MPLFTELEGEWSFMIQFMFKIVYLSLAVLNLYRCCIIWFWNSTVFNVKVKNFAFVTSKVITNAWFYEELVTCMLCQKKLNICINKTLRTVQSWIILSVYFIPNQASAFKKNYYEDCICIQRWLICDMCLV